MANTKNSAKAIEMTDRSTFSTAMYDDCSRACTNRSCKFWLQLTTAVPNASNPKG